MDTETTFQYAFWTLLALMLAVRGYFTARIKQAGERFLPDKAAIQREGGLMFALRFILFFVLIGILVLYALRPPFLRALSFPLPGWLRWIGFALGISSLTMVAWSQAELGRHWSAQLQLREGHELVISGPYQWIRHPLYTAGLGYVAGLALVSASWPFIGLAFLVAVGLLVRVPKEEAMLIEKFGDEYRNYIRRTGRFLPRLGG
jgi:protein-S-isoprenylcysteine O-methyltransferase Ste14